MSRRSALLSPFLLALAGCNFSLDHGWVPPNRRDGAVDATILRGDAGAEAGQEMAIWCRIVCAASDDLKECEDPVFCADAAVCADEPPCDRCSVCRDQ
jgi:hypothetical protein